MKPVDMWMLSGPGQLLVRAARERAAIIACEVMRVFQSEITSQRLTTPSRTNAGSFTGAGHTTGSLTITSC